MKRRSTSSQTMRRRTQASDCFFGSPAINREAWKNSSEPSCPIRIWRKRITTSASPWRDRAAA